MKTVYKYNLNIAEDQLITLPAGAHLLSVREQFGLPCLWAQVDTDRYSEARRIAMYGTGHTMREGVSHVFIDTFTLQGGTLVFHVFEIVS